MEVAQSEKRFSATIAELVAEHNLDYQALSGLFSLLRDKGVVTLEEKRKQPGGRGKPSNVFSIPETITINLKKGGQADA